MTTFYLVRHGETEWNVLGRIQGHSDSVLTKKGEQQAEVLAKELSHIHFDEAFSSDLVRAKKTAEIITLEKKLAVQTTKQLREMFYGDKEGGKNSELFELFKEWDKLSDDEQMKKRVTENAESDEEAVNRFITFLREAAVAYAEKNVLVVAHGALMFIFLVKVGFASYKDIEKIDNCGWIKVTSDGVDFFVNETKGVEFSPTFTPTYA